MSFPDVKNNFPKVEKDGKFATYSASNSYGKRLIFRVFDSELEVGGFRANLRECFVESILKI